MEENLHLVKLYVDGKETTFDLSPLVTFSNRNINELSLEEIDDHLEKISAYRVSILTLKEKIDFSLQVYKEKFDKWLSENHQEVIKTAIDRRLKIKEESKVPNNWFGSITKEEVRGIYMSSEKFNQIYFNFVKEIRNYQRSFNIISGVLKILEDRGSQLQSILKSKTKRIYQ